MFSLDQVFTLESFHRHLLVYFVRTNFFQSSQSFLKKLESSVEL